MSAAAVSGHWPLLEWLQQQGAHAPISAYSRRKAIGHVIRNRNSRVLTWLLENAAPGDRQSLATYGLAVAVEHDNLEAARFVMAYNPSINKPSHDSKVPLHIAAERESSSMIELLLEHNADVTILDDLEESPLIKALRIGNNRVIALLKAHSKA